MRLLDTLIFMITSTSNSQVKNLIALNKKAKTRREQQVFLAEGIKMCKEAPKELLRKVYVSETFFQEDAHQQLVSGMDYEVLKDSVFQAVSDTQTPQGILSVIEMPKWDLKETLSKKGCFLLLENIQDPGNLGTMLRTGEGAGVTAVLVDKTTVDIYNPKTIRSTMGSIYRVPFFVLEDIKEAIQLLKEQGIMVYAAHLEGSVPYDEPHYENAAGFLIGNEGNGLKEGTAKLSDMRIRIPMEGEVESLNAAIAATILMYEAKRQRKG